MGNEIHYQTDDTVECFNCGKETYLTFDIWEYPIGAHNFDDIYIDEGKIIQSPGFVDYFWDKYDYDEPDEDMFRDR